jgi:hypothetical protein
MKTDPLQQLCPIKKAAALLGRPYWQVQRAVRDRLVPSYTFLNGRRLVRPSEILDFIERTREGGAPGAATASRPTPTDDEGRGDE